MTEVLHEIKIRRMEMILTEKASYVKMLHMPANLHHDMSHTCMLHPSRLFRGHP